MYFRVASSLFLTDYEPTEGRRVILLMVIEITAVTEFLKWHPHDLHATLGSETLCRVIHLRKISDVC
jgi:hypothetical protein